MRELRWASQEGDGIEHLKLRCARRRLRSRKRCRRPALLARAAGLHYTVRCDVQWRTRHALAERLSARENWSCTATARAIGAMVTALC